MFLGTGSKFAYYLRKLFHKEAWFKSRQHSGEKDWVGFANGVRELFPYYYSCSSELELLNCPFCHFLLDERIGFKPRQTVAVFPNYNCSTSKGLKREEGR